MTHVNRWDSQNMQCHAHISSIKGTRVAGALLDMGQWKQTGFFPHEVNLMVQQKGEKKKRKKIAQNIIMYSSIKTECLSLWILIHNYLKINKEYNKTLLQKENISSISSKPDTAVFCTGVTLSIQSQHSITKSYTHFHQVSPQGFQVISHTMSLTPYVH